MGNASNYTLKRDDPSNIGKFTSLLSFSDNIKKSDTGQYTVKNSAAGFKVNAVINWLEAGVPFVDGDGNNNGVWTLQVCHEDGSLAMPPIVGVQGGDSIAFDYIWGQWGVDRYVEFTVPILWSSNKIYTLGIWCQDPDGVFGRVLGTNILGGTTTTNLPMQGTNGENVLCGETFDINGGSVKIGGVSVVSSLRTWATRENNATPPDWSLYNENMQAETLQSMNTSAVNGHTEQWIFLSFDWHAAQAALVAAGITAAMIDTVELHYNGPNDHYHGWGSRYWYAKKKTDAKLPETLTNQSQLAGFTDTGDRDPMVAPVGGDLNFIAMNDLKEALKSSMETYVDNDMIYEVALVATWYVPDYVYCVVDGVLDPPAIRINWDNTTLNKPTTFDVKPEIGIIDTIGTPTNADVVWPIINGDSNTNATGTLHWFEIVNGVRGATHGPYAMNNSYNNSGYGVNWNLFRPWPKSANISDPPVLILKALSWNTSNDALIDLDSTKVYEFQITVQDSEDGTKTYNPSNGYVMGSVNNVVGRCYWPYGVESDGLNWVQPVDNHASVNTYRSLVGGNDTGFFIASRAVNNAAPPTEPTHVELWEFSKSGYFRAHTVRKIDDGTNPPPENPNGDNTMITPGTPIWEIAGAYVNFSMPFTGDTGSGNTPATCGLFILPAGQGIGSSHPITLTRSSTKGNFTTTKAINSLSLTENYTLTYRITDSDGITGGSDGQTVIDIDGGTMNLSTAPSNISLSAPTVTGNAAGFVITWPYTNPVGSDVSLFHFSAAGRYIESAKDHNLATNWHDFTMAKSQTAALVGNFSATLAACLDNTNYDIDLTCTNDQGIEGTNPEHLTNQLTNKFDVLTPTWVHPGPTDATYMAGGLVLSGDYTLEWELPDDPAISQSLMKTEIQVWTLNDPDSKYPAESTNWIWFPNKPKLTAGGATTCVEDFSKLNSTSYGRLRIRTVVTYTATVNGVPTPLTRQSAWVNCRYNFDISSSSAPDMPTNLSPDIDSRGLQPGNNINFYWKHNGINKQSQALITWWDKADMVEHEVSVGADSFYTFDRNTFPVGTIQWKVKTWCKLATGTEVPSPESNLAQWKCSILSEKPEIQNPTDAEVLDTATLAVDWLLSNATVQTARQIRIEDNTNGDTEVYNTNKQMVANKAIICDYLLQHGVNYTVYVKTWNADDVASAEDSVSFSTSFTAPDKPLLTVTPDSEAYSVICQITNPVTGVTADRNDLYRFDKFNRDAVRIGYDVGNYFEDATVAGGLTYYYFVMAWSGEGGAYSLSDVASCEITIDGCEIRDSVNPALFVRFRAYPDDDSGELDNFTTIDFYEGRTDPGSTTGSNLKTARRLNVEVYSIEDRNRMEQMYKDAHHLLYRDNFQNRFYMMIDGGLGNTRIVEASGWYSFPMSFVKVDHPEGTVITNVMNLGLDNIDEALRG